MAVNVLTSAGYPIMQLDEASANYMLDCGRARWHETVYNTVVIQQPNEGGAVLQADANSVGPDKNRAAKALPIKTRGRRRPGTGRPRTNVAGVV